MHIVLEKLFPGFLEKIRNQLDDMDEQHRKEAEQLIWYIEKLRELDEQIREKDEQISRLLSAVIKTFRSHGLSDEEIMDTLEIDLSTLQMYLG